MIKIKPDKLFSYFQRHLVMLSIFLLMTILGAVVWTSDSLSEQWRNWRQAQLNASAREARAEAEEQGRGKERYDSPSEAAEFYNFKRAPDGKNLPMERYFTAMEQIKKMPRYDSSSATFAPSQEDQGLNTQQLDALGTWAALGPGNIGGRTRALLIDPTNTTTMYAAGVSGGVWKTTNSGASWTPLADLMANIAVCSLAMDPANSNIIYAGTGESFSDGYDVTIGGTGQRGAGVFKTTDGGLTWTRLANTNTSNFYFVNDIVISPTSGQRIYAATETGVFRSLDGGNTWASVHSQPRCTDLAIRTDQASDYVFAACRPSGQGTIYRNTNAGGAGTWDSVFTEVGMGRTSLAIAPSSQGVIYAIAASTIAGPNNNFLNGLHAVFRSTSSGNSGTWTAQVRNTSSVKLNTVLFTNPREAFRTECGIGTSTFAFNQGYYDNVIAVDPADSNRVWVGGIDLFRSDNGGANWGIASYWDNSGGRADFAHADHHAIVFHPQFNGTTNQTMYVGNDGGLYRTSNARAATNSGSFAACQPAANSSALVWAKLNNSYGTTQFYHGLPYPNGTTYFGGTQDNGNVRGSDAAGLNGWNEIYSGDGGYVAVDPANTNTLYVEYTYLSIVKSTNGGSSFASAINGITEASSHFRFINPFVMDPSNSQRLWTGGFYLWRTTNGAANWSQASAVTSGSGSVSAIAVAPSNANFLLAGMSDGYIHRTSVGLTSDSSTTWPSMQPRTGHVSWVAFDPTNQNIAYATYSTFGGTHVWKSTNAGANWTGIDGSGATGVPDIPVHCLVVDPSSTSRLYLGTDLGVFVSTDGSATWAVENSGFSNVTTEALAVNSVGGTPNLFAFTHGRGAWRVAIAASLCPTVSGIAPSSGAVGSSVVISGANFTGVTSVKFSNNVTAAITGNTGTQLTVTVPTGAVSGPITISKTGCPDVQTGTFTVTSSSPCTPAPITVGQTVNGQLISGDCVLGDGSYADLYSFTGTTGQQIAISLNSSAFDAYLLLTNPSNVVIATDDDGGGSTNARIPSVSGYFTLPASGSYTIYANSLSAGQTGAYSLTLSGPSTASGLQFYPLSAPVRLLETRAGYSGCTNTGAAINAGAILTLPARTTCSGVPSNAASITGNVTVVPSGAGYITLFPSSAAQPIVANSNFATGEITNNVFTVGLGSADGALKIYTSAQTHVIIDVTGYYAPPGTGGLYFHPLPNPVRLVETRPGYSGCIATSTKLIGTGNPNADPSLDFAVQGRSPLASPCNSIPSAAQVLVGNATTIFPSGLGYLTIYPSGGTRPTVASSNYAGADVINGPFAVKLGADGKFKVYTFATTDVAIDILGYYSAEATDANGQGLLFTQIGYPVRLLETRTSPSSLPGCVKPGFRLQSQSVIYSLVATSACDGIGFSAARAIVGNATVVTPDNAGYLTFFPVGQSLPTVATSNFKAGGAYNRHYFVGLNATTGDFAIYFNMNGTQFTTDLVIDVSGYFAP